MMFALIMGAVAAYAQQSSGDYYEGLSRKIGFSQMIPPHGLDKGGKTKRVNMWSV